MPEFRYTSDPEPLGMDPDGKTESPTLKVALLEDGTRRAYDICTDDLEKMKGNLNFKYLGKGVVDTIDGVPQLSHDQQTPMHFYIRIK